MLETKNLCKTYKPKKGVPVMAVDHVSLRFPEKGMVFLLGKSGSGKSTMLNLLGGLDQYDDGEIIIKGISSKDFSQQRFDSYRNTYVGFIFQEYNVLEEFTVGANIALALELQGKQATDEELNAILTAVDLAGYGSRKPNELSGGQKQRVAIARALVKNPEIIMADEPTGALDSNTGRQVLDTLKKLSAEKLVIVVSHDREYAELYADRIIELADGKVIRDVEAVQSEESAEEKKLVFRSTSIEIPPDYHLTEEDRIQINEYLDALRSGTGASMMLPAASQRFKETDESAIPVQDGSKFSLIKSKLPMKSAFKIGCSSLKHKRFRLVMTVLLSVAAFSLFALVDTFSAYDHIRACTDSIIDSDVNYVSVNKSVKRGKGIDAWWTSYGYRISEKDMEAIRKDTGINVTGLFLPRSASLSFKGQYDDTYKFTEGQYNTALNHCCGFAEVDEAFLREHSYEIVAGKVPDGKKNEIMVSSALCETFVKAGYHAPLTEAEAANAYEADEKTGEPRSTLKFEKIASPKDMVGKVLNLGGTEYTISGVVDTNFDLSRYDKLLESAERQSRSEELVNYLLWSEYSTTVNYSLTGAAMVGKGKVAEMVAAEPKVYESQNGGCNINTYTETENSDTVWLNVNAQYYTKLDKIPDSEIVWLNGKKDHLAEDEFIIPLSGLELYCNKQSVISKLLDKLGAYQEGTEEITAEGMNQLIKDAVGSNLLTYNYYYSDPETGEWTNYPDYTEHKAAKIVGVVKADSAYADAMVICDDMAQKLIHDTEGIYDSAVGGMPESRAEVEKFVRYCYRNNSDVTERYELNNAVTYELDTVNDVLKVLAKVFLYIGIAFAVFAALLMANFITTSIHYKRQEIGILRAIGSRSNDVFRIFFSESFVIAMINFVISAVICCAGVMVINFVLRKYVGILITVLHFGIRQILLLFVISVAIAAIASFLPVRRIAAKKPIDAIRDK